VLAVTGFEPGAVAPFALNAPVPVFVEQALLAHEHVWVGAGSSRHLAALAPHDLLRLTRGEPADLVE
jgi:prolyl-tRNA editing enzyme YbaK/EbsC (Cys-tRNA(Pro) deacylase)